MKWIAYLFASILTFSTLHGFEMEEITTFDQIVPLFEEVGPETLVVFDVDNVLTIPDHPAFQIPNWMKHRELVRHYYGELTENEKEALSNLMVTQNALRLIERSVLDLISNLSSRGVPVIALTGLWSGGDLSRQRWGMLHSLGIEFKGKESWGEIALFDQFPCYNSSYPLYFKGILFTNGQAVGKGELLEFFFNLHGDYPKRVCFIDDQKGYLESVGEVMERLGIPCDLYWYHGAKNFPSDAIDRDQMETVWNFYMAQAKQMAPQEIVR